MPKALCSWRSFVEEESYGKSVINCVGYKNNDEVTLASGWALSNRAEHYRPILPNSEIRMLQTKEISWTNPPIPPMRLFFKILDGQGKISLLHIEEDVF